MAAPVPSLTPDIKAPPKKTFKEGWNDFFDLDYGPINFAVCAAGNLLSWANLDPRMPPWGVNQGMDGGVINAVYPLFNYPLSVLADPNIGGIPIKATAQRCSREVDISEQMIITQSVMGNAKLAASKEYLTDNACPQPREWSVEGHLCSLMTIIDSGLNVKLTLVGQIQALNYYASRRLPVWFKSYYFDFKQVLIKHFEYSFVPEDQSSVHVSIVMREFVAMKGQVQDGTLSTGAKPAEPASPADLANMQNVGM